MSHAYFARTESCGCWASDVFLVAWEELEEAAEEEIGKSRVLWSEEEDMVDNVVI